MLKTMFHASSPSRVLLLALGCEIAPGRFAGIRRNKGGLMRIKSKAVDQRLLVASDIAFTSTAGWEF